MSGLRNLMFRSTSSVLSQSPSSRAWLARQYSDPYVRNRLAYINSYRSRSAFKLIEIDAHWGHFLTKSDVRAVLDLGAAPGGWSQVVAGKLGWSPNVDGLQERTVLKAFGYGARGNKLKEKWGTWSEPKLARHKQKNGEEQNEPFDPLNIDDEFSSSSSNPSRKPARGRGTIVAVDLLPMDPIPGVLDLQANFLDPSTEDHIHSLLSVKGNPEGMADIILSDMAANMTGSTTRDVESSLEICEAIFGFATRHLRTAESIGRTKGGVLLMKYFSHPLLYSFQKTKLIPNFNDVRIVKPDASRSESKEAYFLCQGWTGLH